METIKLKKELHKELLHYSHFSETALYLIGKDKEGVCTKAEELSTSGGCAYTPGAAKQAIISGYINLVKLGLIPIAFARVGEANNTGWGLDSGYDYERHPHMVFITYGWSGKSAIKFNQANHRKQKVKIELV